MFYLSTATIEAAYKELIKTELISPNDLLNFLILKACGINKLTYQSFEKVKEGGLYYASRLMSLFSPEEGYPDGGGVINPFDMKKWPSQPINDDLKKWVSQRLQNNVIGGGTQWRALIDMDAKDKTIKFKYDYVKLLKTMTLDSKTVNLIALSIWSHRFTPFEQKETIRELCDEFQRSYKLDVDEVNAFFNRGQNFDIEYSDHIFDASKIRSMINNVPTSTWKTITAPSSTNERNHAKWCSDNYSFATKPADTQEVDIELIQGLLNTYHQVILEGPPGTSKSYYASEIANAYDDVIHVQFHPQYSYQNFVGGFVVSGTEVVYKPGVIIELIKYNYKPDKKYLIIIDEFNRANVSQVLGEVIQCLDRTQSVNIEIDGALEEISLPKNIHILATLNTTDKTLGTIDYAIKRRFMSVYCAPDPRVLMELCPSAGFVSLCDFLTKLNKKLLDVTGSRDLTVGHAIFLNDSVKQGDKYVWGFEDFRILYNYKILPMIEDYCSNNNDMVIDVVGRKLSVQLDGTSFADAICDYLEIAHV